MNTVNQQQQPSMFQLSKSRFAVRSRAGLRKAVETFTGERILNLSRPLELEGHHWVYPSVVELHHKYDGRRFSTSAVFPTLPAGT